MGPGMGRGLFVAAFLLVADTTVSADDAEDRALIGVPGYTLTNEVLRADVIRVARLSVPTLVKRKTGDEGAGECKQTDFLDAMITAIGNGGPGNRTWSEIWTFQVCERTVHVPIRFEPASQGGANFTLSDKGMIVDGKSEAAP
jgi:hypothetical protein